MKLLKYAGKYWHFALFCILFKIGEVCVDLYQPRMMETIVDDGILGLRSGGVTNVALVQAVGIRMILIVILGGVMAVIGGIFANLFAQNFGNDLRKACFARVMNLSFEQTDEFSIGSLITRMTSDITQVQNMASNLVRGGSRCITFLIAGTFCLLSLDLNFGQALRIAIPVIVVWIIVIELTANPLFTRLQRQLDRMNTVIRENITGIRVVKAFVQEDREVARFHVSNEELAGTQFRVLLLVSYLQPVINIVLNIAVVAVIKIGAVDVKEGAIEPGVVMAAITYLSLLLSGLRILATIFQNIARGVPSSGRLREILRTKPSINSGCVTEGKNHGSIRFQNVSFRYHGMNTDSLHNINLEIRPGEMLAIIGATGCGKSTLVDLIPRFYDTSGGKVYVDGINVREYDLETLREKISFVLQKSELFSSTIRENIALGRPGASMEEIRRAAAAAQADEFIRKQPMGYETPVAEAGMSLSGGQRQRIAIARALLKKAEILILDDATSALDLKTEALLHRSLREEYGNMTIVIIAQRIATVMNADRIAVVNNGTIVACDSHENLMNTCGIYLDIYNSQLKEEPEAI